jgi:DNA polymerase-3 subunit alpha
MAGQMSLFDIVSEDQKEEFDIKLPDVGEYSKEMKLAFEKEVLGIYVSGHPLEEYEELWKKHIKSKTTDFLLDEETGSIRVADGEKTKIGGLITEKKLKYTKNNQVMAFLTLEDLVGSIEVIVFPKAYSKYSSLLTEDRKVFISGRVSGEDERDGKLFCEEVTAFEDVPRKLWIQFSTMDEYKEAAQDMTQILSHSEGKDSVVLYIRDQRLKKVLPPNQNVYADKLLVSALEQRFGAHNIKLTV